MAGFFGFLTGLAISGGAWSLILFVNYSVNYWYFISFLAFIGAQTICLFSSLLFGQARCLEDQKHGETKKERFLSAAAHTCLFGSLFVGFFWLLIYRPQERDLQEYYNKKDEEIKKADKSVFDFMDEE